MATANIHTNLEHGSNQTYINGNSIEAFFADSVILITGATGFVGKVLLEKLLRSCPRLDTVYILLRSKRNQTVEERCKQLIANTIFDDIRQKNPSIFSKIYPIKGDVSLPNLGLSPEDTYILEEKVTIVFHSAATIRFDEPLKVAVNMNTMGTDRLIDLCKNMKNLRSIVHVSTAYSNANRLEIQESIYQTKVKPSTVIDLCESLDDETLYAIQDKILEQHPNTYTFAKNLAEQLLQSRGKDMPPIAIVRPSIICAAMKEPFPGWLDNLAGITGGIMEISKGTVRTMLCNPSLKADTVPVDYVVDTIICASWHSTMHHSNSIKIYNCTTNAKPFRWGQLNELVNKYAIETPTSYLMWYPGCRFTTNIFLHNFISFILHVLPAIVGDFYLRLIGNKPMLMKFVKHFGRVNNAGKFFTLREWGFNQDNMNDLRKKIKALKDCDSFNVSMEQLDWDTYVSNYNLGIRRYVLNESPGVSTIAKSRLYVFYWLHRLIQVSSIIILLTMILRIGH